MYTIYSLTEGGEGDIVKGEKRVVKFQAVVRVIVDYS